MDKTFDFLFQLLKEDPHKGTVLICIILTVIILKDIIPVIWKVVETILKQYGIIKDPIYSLLERLNNKLSAFISEHESTSITLLNMVKIVADKQHSFLTNEQVSIVTKLTFKYLERDLMIKIMEEYDKFKDEKFPDIQILQDNIKKIFELTIKDTDRYYFQLPNTDGKVIPTDQKILSFYSDYNNYNTCEKIMIILQSQSSLLSKKNTISYELGNLIDKWYQTL